MSLLKIGACSKLCPRHLTEKETSILRYLCRASPRPVSRETLLQEVWGYNSRVTTHRLETHIMFSDLVGSTALSARMDPEDLRKVMRDGAHDAQGLQELGRLGIVLLVPGAVDV